VDRELITKSKVGVALAQFEDGMQARQRFEERLDEPDDDHRRGQLVMTSPFGWH